RGIDGVHGRCCRFAIKEREGNMRWLDYLRRLWMWLVLLFTVASHRIVSTAPSVTEILLALGAGDRVVGDTLYCNYPVAAKSKPKIGGYATPNIELILALNPDPVFVNDSQTNVVAALRQTGRIDVITLHPDS